MRSRISWRQLAIALGCLILVGFGIWFAQHTKAQSRPQSTSQTQKAATSSKASSAQSSSKKRSAKLSTGPSLRKQKLIPQSLQMIPLF